MAHAAAALRSGKRALASILLVSFALTGVPTLTSACGCDVDAARLRSVAVATARPANGGACACLIPCGSVSCFVSPAPALRPTGTQIPAVPDRRCVSSLPGSRVVSGPEPGPPAPPPKSLILLA
jgi:hypothetical protein